MHPIWLERVEGGALTLANLKPASFSRSRSALQLFFEPDHETGELVAVPLPFAVWKIKASEAGLLTGATEPARDMSARRLLATVKNAKWIEDSQGFWKPTEKGVTEFLR